MSLIPPPPSNRGNRPPIDGPPTITIQTPQLPLPALIAVIVLLLALGGVGYWWFVQRIEVPAGNVLILTNRFGSPLPAEQFNGAALEPAFRNQVVLFEGLLGALGEAPGSTRFQGVMYEPLPPGRYFYDPFFWHRKVVPLERVEDGEVGVKVRKYGAPLPPGKVVATTALERGPLAEVLPPGDHAVNPHAYAVVRVPGVRIPPGSVGVQRLLSGNTPDDPNVWVVGDGELGVQPNVLQPGYHRINPYLKRVDLIDTRSKTLDLRDADAIRFPSKDSFEIVLEATVEYAIRQDRAPYVYVAIGDHNDVADKVILPFARSLARIEGSKLLAREFISGERREAFQQSVFEGLRDLCGEQGIEIRATPIRRIEPPEEIARPISDRQIATQQINRFRNEIEVAVAQAELVTQEELQKQNKAIGQANREVVTVVKQAQQSQAVALTEASKRLEVAKLRLESAKEEAAAIRSRGEADAEIVLLRAKAEAEPLRDAIRAFGGGESYAQFFFYQKLGPSLKAILASTDGPFADIFRSLATQEGAAPLSTVSTEGDQ